jgi:hypothetical protein
MVLHGRRDEAVRHYEVLAPDQRPGEPHQVLRLMRDGVCVLEWRVDDAGVIVSPEPFAGRKALSGLSSWATETLEGDLLEAALILQKGYFQCGSRRMDMRTVRGPIRDREEAHKGVCWSFSSPQFERAERTGSWRDFSDGKDLLAFKIPEGWTP